MQKDYIVTKSNKLISANYDLSLQEQKIILTLASMVQPSDTEFKAYEFKIKDFINLLDVKDKKKYIEVPKITKELMKKVFEIRDGNDLVQLSWLCSARYKTKEGTVLLKFAPDLKPYLLQLKQFYTSYRLDNILQLKSKYSIRLYEVLKSNAYKKTFEIDLDELKKMIGANAKAYNTYANFKNRILNKTLEEINALTDIKFAYEEKKTGRKVTSIRFCITPNVKAPKEISPPEDHLPSEDTEVLPKENSPIEPVTPKEEAAELTYVLNLVPGISKNEAKKLLVVADNDIERIAKKHALIKLTPSIVGDLGVVKWLIKSLLEDSFQEEEETIPTLDDKEKKEMLKQVGFLLQDWNLEDTEIKEIVSAADWDWNILNEKIEVVNKYANNNVVKNYKKLMISAINENWKPDYETKQVAPQDPEEIVEDIVDYMAKEQVGFFSSEQN